MKIRYSKYLAPGILLVIAVLFILYMSTMNGTMSHQLSKIVSNLVVRDLLQLEISGWRMDVIDFIIRKIAHFVMYFGLGLVGYGYFYHRTHSIKKSMVCGWSVGIVISILDELQQLFRSGRTGRWYDVLIDGSGLLIAVIVFGLFTTIIHYLDMKNRDKN